MREKLSHHDTTFFKETAEHILDTIISRILLFAPGKINIGVTNQRSSHKKYLLKKTLSS